MVCGGIYDFDCPLVYDPGSIDLLQPGIWKYKDSFWAMNDLDPVSLGEGDTPLIWSRMHGLDVAVKCEFLNPTGSFKDRGSSLLASFFKSRKILSCIEDSSGNAGASMAAYSARAGISLSVYIPDTSSGIKREQIKAYGANLIPIAGTRVQVHAAARKAADEGASYASHAYLPFNIPGYATVAYEIFEQLGGKAPGTVIVPVGQGGLLIGLSRGFKALKNAGMIVDLPAMVGVQARACAPLWSLFVGGIDGLRFATDGPTLAEGVRVWQPIRGDSLLNEIGSSFGKFFAVDEKDILVGMDELARLGFYVEPTSALVWNALSQCGTECSDPVVLVLTGSGLKHQS